MSNDEYPVPNELSLRLQLVDLRENLTAADVLNHWIFKWDAILKYPSTYSLSIIKHLERSMRSEEKATILALYGMSGR
jgi:hypothetical protein